MKKIFFFIVLTLFMTSMRGQEYDYNIKKLEADSAYIKGNYAQAIQIYEDILRQGEAAEIYYNLGNSYYKSDNIARAILNYERALLLRPDNQDIRANLEIARSKTVDKIVPIPEIFFVSWGKSLINSLNIDSWARLGIVSFLLCLVAVSLFFFSKTAKLKKIGFISGVVLFTFTVLSNVFANQQKKSIEERTEAIVLTPSVTVRSTPSENGTSLFIIHEGRKIKIKDNSMREWKEISLEDGKVGWVPANSLEVI